MDLAEVANRLEMDIIFGRLKPRERLVEEDLARRFEAKRHIVRSALAELERLGIVVRRPNRGAMVRDYSITEVEELYELRASLHRLAVDFMPLPFDPARLNELRSIHARHCAAVERHDMREVFELNNAFHDTLFDACGNRYLAEAIRQHAWLAHAIRSYRMADPLLLSQARDEHAAMIEALAVSDRGALRELCVRHIQPSKQAYLRGQGWLDSSGDRVDALDQS